MPLVYLLRADTQSGNINGSFIGRWPMKLFRREGRPVSLEVNAHHPRILNLNYTSITGVVSRVTALRAPCSVLRNRIAMRKEEAAGWGQRISFRQRDSCFNNNDNNNNDTTADGRTFSCADRLYHEVITIELRNAGIYISSECLNYADFPPTFRSLLPGSTTLNNESWTIIRIVRKNDDSWQISSSSCAKSDL